MTTVLSNTTNRPSSTVNLSPGGDNDSNNNLTYRQISIKKFLACMENSGSKVTHRSDHDTGEPSYLQCTCEVFTPDNKKISKIFGIGDPVTIKALLTGSDPSNNDSDQIPSPIENSKKDDGVDGVPTEPDDGPMEPSISDETIEEKDYGFGGEEKKKEHPLAHTPGLPFAVE